MATSLAKLAIVLTADTNQLKQGFGQATNQVRRFDRQVSTVGMGRGGQGLGKMLTTFNAGLAVSSGRLTSLAALARGGGPYALLAGGIAVATAAVIRFEAQQEAQLAKLKDELHELTRDVRIADRGMTEFAGTAASQWEDLKSNISRTGKLLMSHIAAPFMEATSRLLHSFTDVFERIVAQLESTSIGQRFVAREKEIAEYTKRVEEAKKALEEQAEAEKKLAEETQRRMDAMKRNAESITKSLRTPVEEFADAVAELNELFGEGLLAQETWTRGIRKARADLVGATKAARDFSRSASARPSVGAAEMGTQTARSAIFEAKAELKRLEDVAKEQKRLQAEANRLLEEGNRIARERPQLVVQQGRL